MDSNQREEIFISPTGVQTYNIKGGGGKGREGLHKDRKKKVLFIHKIKTSGFSDKF